MTLRQKTFSIIGLTLLGLVVVLYLTFQAVLMGGFNTIEQRETRKNVSRVKDALTQELDGLSRTTGDYAHWDDTYAFVENRQQDYIDTNFYTDTYVTMELNLVMIVNLQGEVIYGAVFNSDIGVVTALSDDLARQILAEKALLLPGVEIGSLSGVVFLDQGPMLVASEPILTSQTGGPRRGTLIFGRRLDEGFIQKLEALTQLSIDIFRWDAPDLTSKMKAVQDSLSSASPIAVRPLNGQINEGFTYFDGVTNEPIMLIRVDNPRDVYQQGLSSLGYLLVSVAVVGVVYGAIIWWLLGHWVLNPITTISTHMAQIGEKGDLAARLRVVGKDELAHLGKAINAMLAALQQRTQEHERFLNRVNLASDVSRMISSSVGNAVSSNPKLRLDQVVEFIRARFDFYFVGLYLLDEAEEYAVLQAATGDIGQKSVLDGHRLPLSGSSLVWRTISTQRPRVILDTDPDFKVIRFSNPHLSLTRSELALPLISGQKALGALSIQANRPNAFTSEDITVLFDVANDLAAALENIRLFQQVSANLEEIQSLHRKYLVQSWSEVTRTTGKLHYTYENDQIAASGTSPSTISVPIVLRDQEIGHLTLETENDTLTPEQTVFIEAVTSQAALALESARLLEQTQSSAIQERTLADMMQKVRTSTDVDTILQTAISELGRTLRASEAVIRLDIEENHASH